MYLIALLIIIAIIIIIVPPIVSLVVGLIIGIGGIILLGIPGGENFEIIMVLVGVVGVVIWLIRRNN